MSRSKSSSSDESSSSDWSSSDEDDDEGDEAPLRPSTHSALQAQWEWRTMADSLPDKWDSVTSYPSSLFYGLWRAEILHDVLVDSWRIDPWSMNWKCSHVIWECLIEVTLHVRMLQERLGDWFKHFEGWRFFVHKKIALSCPSSPMGTGHTPKKKPPPIAPKPRVSWTHSLPTTDLNYQLIEDPSSFSQVQVIFSSPILINSCIIQTSFKEPFMNATQIWVANKKQSICQY